LEQKKPNSTFKYLSCRKGFLSKTKSILTWKQCAGICSIWHRCFSKERYMCFFNSAELPVWKKMSLSPPWKLWFAGSITFKK
jgi:hypothetical protein